MNWGLEKGAEKFGGLVAVGGEKLRQNLQPASSEKPVEDKYQRGFEIARHTSNKVVIVSSYVGTCQLTELVCVCSTHARGAICDAVKIKSSQFEIHGIVVNRSTNHI